MLTSDIWDLFKAKEPPIILLKENPDRNMRFWGEMCFNKSLDGKGKPVNVFSDENYKRKT